jgi:hypothetical protein
MWINNTNWRRWSHNGILLHRTIITKIVQANPKKYGYTEMWIRIVLYWLFKENNKWHLLAIMLFFCPVNWRRDSIFIFLVFFCIYSALLLIRSRAIAQAVSRRLPTAAVGVHSQVRSCGICGGQSGIEARFLRVLRFPLPILIPPAPSRLSCGAGTIGPLVPCAPSGLTFAPPHE